MMISLFLRVRRRVSLGVVFVSLCAGTLCAQRMVIADKTAETVLVEKAEVSAEITGGIAVTTFDLVFRNPNGRVLEGTFEFPLLDGQNVVRFALDIGGTLREAVPVPKEKGRVVFEEIERRRVDPGLLEQTEGNNYRARVFPLPAGGTRRICIAYQEDLKRGAGQGGRADYKVALAFAEKLKNFKLVVSLLGGAREQAKATTTLPLELPAWSEARRIEVEKQDFAAKGVLELALQELSAPAVITGRNEESEYFVAELPVAGVTKVQARPVPRVVGILWDASGSGAGRDHEREFALLEAYFARLQSVRVKLVLLQDKARSGGDFEVSKGGWGKLRRALKEIDYDAASSLDGITEDATVDEWLYFGDGLINYGATLGARTLPLGKPVHCVLAAAGGNTTWLRGVARRSGGEFVDLMATDTAAAAQVLAMRGLRVLSVQGDKGAFAELFPEVGAVVEGGLLRVAGRLRAKEGTVRVRIGHDASDARELEVNVRSGENPTRLAPRGWALAKIRELSLEAEANREDIRRTSAEFCIITPDTSLIVLETLADYQRYAITPPDELRGEWERVRTQRLAFERTDKRTHLDDIVRRFAQRVEWWEKEYPKDDYKVPEPPKGGGLLREAAIQRELDMQVQRRREEQTPVLASVPPGASAADEVVTLSPFSVSDGRGREYSVKNSLAGSRRGTSFGGASANFKSVRPSPDQTSSVASSIALRPWKANAGYLERLRRADESQWDEIYHEERETQSRTPGFYLDVAEFLFSKDRSEDALMVLSNLAELGLEDAGLLRVLAHRLQQAGRADLAVPLLERVLAIRGEEPQSYRDLALALAETGRGQRAIELLWTVVTKPWHNRFPDIELIALTELNAIVAASPTPLDTSAMDPRLLRNLPLGLRVVLAWDADNSDIDLWVRDPNGENVGYNHPASYQGGRISRDFTGGYGPEEFALREPKAGKYGVRLNYFGDRRQSSFGPVTAHVLVYTDYGTPRQKLQRMMLRLFERKENAEVGEVVVDQGGKED